MFSVTQNATKGFVISNSRNYSGTPRQFSSNQFYIFLAFSALLAVVIVAGNSLVLVSYKINVRLQTRTNRFLASLAVCDLLVGAVSIPLWIYTSRRPYSKVLYNIFMCLDIASAIASILHLTGICVERFMAISMPLRHRTVRLCVFNLMIAVAWIIALMAAIIYPFQKEYNFTKAYVIVVFIFGFAGPLVTISGMHIVIYQISRRVLRSNTLRDQAQQRMIPRKRKQHIQKETRTLLTVTMVTFLFFIAWSPFFILLLLSIFFPRTLPSSQSVFKLVLFAKWMHYWNSAVNPFVYAFRNIEMRNTFLHVLKMICYCSRRRKNLCTRTVRFESRIST